MFRILFIANLFLPAIAAQGAAPSAWGFFAHRQLNRHAVYLLPASMKVFYRPHIHQLSENAVNPDRRRHIVPNEAARHYIDLDRYPFPDSLPRQWREAEAVYARDSLMKHGIVPWHILRQLRALTNAFRLRDGTAILKLSADLGHYIGDAHVPLHTTSNYDGQHTQQEGIHGLWESRIPELYFDEFDLFTGAVRYIDDPSEAIWNAVLLTHELVDSVLSIEKSLQEEMGEHRMRGFEYRGNRLQYVYSRDYASAYHRRLGDMVASQFRRALLMTASLWYTCWVNAGQPDLSDCSYRYGYPEAWRRKYDSLYRVDSLIFQQDIHLKTGSGSPAAKSFSNMYFCAMNYLSAENLRVSYGDNVLFSKVSLGISQGQKIALVGINGSGKSTLLRVLAGLEKPETGEVAYANGLSIAYLPQLPELDPSADVLDAVMMSDDPVISLVREYERCLSRAHEPAQERRLTDLVSKMDSANAWNYESQVKEILGKLGIHDLYQKIGNMSGGQRKRVGIARALLQQPDLVILDEPTNHLDLDAIEWLEDFLSTSNMAIIMVTHDRYFLENVTNEIMELEGGNLYHYQGNYSYYLEKKDERRTLEETEVEKSRNLMRKELDWIRRQPKARGTKAKYRIDAFEDLKKKASKDLSEKSLEVDVVQRRQGGKILELESVSKSYGDKHILQPFSYIFRKREKVGIVGPNGAGKTTFLNIITGRLEPDQGKVDKGPTTVMGYYQQKEPEFDNALKVIDVIREVTDVVTLSDGSKVSASQMLNRFNFPPKKQHDKVGKLSGGEKRRLQLMLVLLKNPNFLILDEPTNDLDLNTLRVLEDFLSSFEGCLLLVSHDRYFMDRLVDHLFIFEAGKEVTDYNGSYSSYREEVREEEAREVKKRTEKPKAETTTPPAKLSYKEKREMEDLESEMEKINRKITELTRQLQSGDLDHEALAEAGAEIGTLRDLLDAKEMRWLELSEKDA